MKKLIVTIVAFFCFFSLMAVDLTDFKEINNEEYMKILEKNGVEYELVSEEEFAKLNASTKNGVELLSVSESLEIIEGSGSKSYVGISNLQCQDEEWFDFVVDCSWTKNGTFTGTRVRAYQTLFMVLEWTEYVSGTSIYEGITPNSSNYWTVKAQGYNLVKVWIPGGGGLPGHYVYLKMYIGNEEEFIIRNCVAGTAPC
ncbi:MAG TPA: hypothetical protein PKG52_10910 [bacterium]|nr:hypothetical protein [bacterium]HPS29685.1 hypothetical protein [bacterium]